MFTRERKYAVKVVSVQLDASGKATVQYAIVDEFGGAQVSDAIAVTGASAQIAAVFAAAQSSAQAAADAYFAKFDSDVAKLA